MYLFRLNTCKININIVNIIFLLIITFITMEMLKNNQIFDLLPDEMVINTFTLINANTLLYYRLVCKRWQKLIDAYVFQEKAALENKFVNNGRGYSSFSKISSNDIRKIELPRYVFYVISKYDPFNRNLIKNHYGQGLWNHWETDINESVLVARFMMKFDNDLSGIFQIPPGEHLLSDPNFDGQTSFFVIDFGDVHTVYQKIIFKDYDLNDILMKTLRPKIVFSSWFNTTEYQSNIKLYRLQASVHSEINKTKVVTADSLIEESSIEWQRASNLIETTGHETYLELNHFVKCFFSYVLIHNNLEVTCSVVKILLLIKYKNSNLLYSS